MASAHVDTFARDHLPPPEALPELRFELPALQFPAQLNCATELLDRHVAEGRGDRLCIQAPGLRWSYAELQAQANRIAHVLVQEMGLVPGNRVLLRSPNNPMLAACWFAVVKAGGIAVGSMPLLRAKELTQIVVKAQISHALCDLRLADEMKRAAADCPTLQQLRYFHDDGADGLEAAMARQPTSFDNIDTAADDICLMAFTSGTTGQPKGTMHFHRDVMAACACWPPHVLRPVAEDIFIGSPPLAFTFGLGGLLLFGPGTMDPEAFVLSLPLARLIRFVAGPDGTVVPDIERRLPGRGLWLTAERDIVSRAVARRLFGKAADRIRRGLEAPYICISYGGSLDAVPKLPGYAALHLAARENGVEILLSPMSKTAAVNVGPGAVSTPINSVTMHDEALLKKLDASIPLGRVAKPEEIANVVAFLASEGASYLTATTVFADGGIMQSSPGL